VHRIGGKVLELQHADFSFGIRKILSDFTYTFKRGEKIGIVGANGIGKSTFLDIITGAQRLDGGKVIIGDTIKYGYYRQEGLTEKDDRRVIDIIKEGAEELSLSDGATLSASSFLTYFGFSTQTQYNYYGNLSGGERRKLYLLKTLIKNPNFLILDEPTNDLDIYNLITLEKFLKQYKGCLLIVSHDRSFLDGVVDHLFIFQDNGQIKDYYGTYQWQDYMKTQAQDELSNKKDNVLNKKRLSYNSREDKAKKLSFKDKKELEEINAMLPQLEKEKDLLTQQISSGALLVEELMQKSKRIQEVIEEIDQKETRWLELSSKDSD
jgi:ATPase components of ABC transporters with duplicated ATPase domains